MTDLTPYRVADRQRCTRWLSEAADRQLRRDLAQLPDLVALVAAHPEQIRRDTSGPRPQPGSRPPTPLAPIALLDQRSRADDLDVIGLSDLDRIAGRRDGIEPTLRSWVLLAEGEMLDDDPDRCTPIPQGQRVAESCAWLQRHIVWVLEQQWVEELAPTVRRMVRDCEAHLRIRPEYHPRCPSCRARLTSHQGWWECRACGRDYRDERMLLALQEPMTAERIGTAFGISPATIRKWKERGHLEPACDEGRPTYHVLDVLRLADARGVDAAG